MAFLHGEFAEPNLQAVPLQRLEFAWMGSPDMIDSSRVYTPADIAALPLLRQSRESGLNMIYDGWLRPHTPASNIFTINSLIAMAGLTAAGFGVSCLPRDYFADMVSARQLVIARTTLAPPQSVYCAMFRRDADVAFCESVAELAESCCEFSGGGR
jgi:DNA-binding transcriptional LysR family regulator